MNRLVTVFHGLAFALLLWFAPHAMAGLSGYYTVGNGGEFATLAQALDSVSAHGIVSDVVLLVSPGTQTGPFVLSGFPGNGESQLTIQAVDGASVLLVSPVSTQPTFLVSSTSMLLFEGLSIQAPASSQPALRIADSCSSIKVTTCTFTGQGTGRAVEVVGSADFSLAFSECLIRHGSEGIFINGTGNSVSELTISDCLIDSVQRGINVSYATGLRIEGCSIRPNVGTGSGATAVFIGTQNPGDSVFVLRNRFSQIRTASGYAVAIRHNPLANSAKLIAANNTIFEFQNTGSSQVRALHLSGGVNRIVNNSILVNDVAATGTAYTIYNGLTSPDSRLTLLNNICANLEATRPSYNLFVLTPAAPLESDHNVFYGTGSSYLLGWHSLPYASLSAWQAGTGLDSLSLSGDPRFASATDLHLQTNSALPHQRGAVALDIETDTDGELRFQPPDIGADEYTFNAPPLDAAILSVHGLPTAVPEQSLLRVEVVVQNRGSLPLIEMPLRLSYDDTARAEVLVNLLPSRADTVLMVWSTAEARGQAPLRFETMLAGDANPTDNGRDFSLAIAGQPLSGIYHVAPFGGDYETLTAAANDLSARGISGPTTIELESGLYAEPLVLENIPGLSAVNSLTIRPSMFADGIVQISPSGSSAALWLDGVSHVTVENIFITGNTGISETAHLANCSDVALRGCQISCTSLDQLSAAAVHVSAGCARLLFDELTISSAYYGLRLEGSSLSSDSGHTVRNCSIAATRTAIYAQWQENLKIENCMIQPGFAGAPSTCYGIRVGALQSGDSVFVTGNRIVSALSQGDMVLLSCETAGGTLVAVNNWLGDLNPELSGALAAVFVSSGTAVLYHNSISLAQTNSPDATAIALQGPATHLEFANNIVQVADPDAQARFIHWSSGTLATNHNLFDSPGASPLFEFAQRSLDDDIQTLSSWVSATGQDSQSVAAPAGFVSTSNLHLRPDAFGPSNHGVALPLVVYDIDFDTRGTQPDLGADEFDYQTSILDLAVESVEIPVQPLPSGVTQFIQSTISNPGVIDVVNAEATLYYNGVAAASQTVTVPHGTSVSQLWPWDAPQLDIAYATMRVEVSINGDAVPQNNSQSRSVVIAGAPLVDSVTVGLTGGAIFTLSELSEHLRWRGVAGSLRVLLTDQQYDEPLTLSGIPGLDSTRLLTIEPHDGQAVILTASNVPAVVSLQATNFVELRGLEIVAGSGTNIAAEISSNSCHNRLVNCIVRGTGAENVNSAGVLVSGSNCHGNIIDSCDVSHCYIGIGLTGTDSTIAAQNLVRGNTVHEAYYGIWADHQRGAEILGNDVTPGSSVGPAGACYGVYVVQLGQQGSARIAGNRLHGFLDSSGPRTNRAAGVYSAPGVEASVEILNNFIYGFNALTTLRARGIYLSSGVHLVANNSIRLDDVPADNDVAAIFVSTGTQHEIYNNCIISYENDVISYALDVEAGAEVISDHNVFWGNSPSFAIAALGAQNYSTMAAWQQTGQDAQSLNLHVLYVSSDDLHIRAIDPVCYGAGVSLPQVTADIDGEARVSPPCIGADEYIYQATLTAPAQLTMRIENGQAILSWQPVTGAARYRLFVGATQEELLTTPLDLGTTTATNWAIDAAGDAGGSKFYFVCAE